MISINTVKKDELIIGKQYYVPNLFTDASAANRSRRVWESGRRKSKKRR